MAKVKNSGLGRGLDAIFVDNSEDPASGISILRVADIEPRADQPRKSFDGEALSSLAASIAAHGLIQPIIVRPSTSGFYEIIAGERRWRAAKMAGLSEVPVIISDFDDQKTAEVALIENIQRENLSPVEEALGYRALMDEYSFTQEEISKRIGKSRPAIANTLRLLELPEEVTAMISKGDLSAGHARTLLGLKDTDEILSCAQEIVRRELSVRGAEELVRQKNRAGQKNLTAEEPDKGLQVDYVGRLEQRAQRLLGRKVRIVHGGRVKKIELSYEDDPDLEQLLRAICGEEIFEH